MPRKSRLTKPGVRKYGVKSNYTPETLEKALDKFKSGALSRMEASKEYKIPPAVEDDIEEDLSQEILNSANNYFENQEECAEELTFIQEYVVSSDGILLETHETSNTEKGQLDGFANGMFCVFKEEGSLFPGCINKVGPEKITVSVLQKNYLGGWSWYSRNERCEIKKENVVSILKEHQITRKDGNIFIEDEMLSMEWGE